MRHTHYVVIAYDESGEGMGGVEIFKGQITVDLLVDNEEDALARAHILAKGRKWYRVTAIFEHDPDLETSSKNEV